MNKEQKTLLTRIIAADVLFVPLYLIGEGVVKTSLPRWTVIVLFLVPYLLAGFDVLREAVEGIAEGEVFDEAFLMAIATVGAIVLGEYAEGAAVMLLFQIGELFQSVAVDRSRRSITALTDLRPDRACLLSGGEMKYVDPSEVEVGSIIVVSPGERIPLDGVVVAGSSSVNTSALTGESLPVDVEEGSEVLSGCVNTGGVLRVRTTADFKQSAASKILDLIENAASSKSRSEGFVSRFAKIYTPVVCCAALALAVLPPLLCMLALPGSYASVGELWRTWLLRACTLLVISCPCAIVISIPLSFFAALGGAGTRGILIKGSNFIETLSEVKTVVFDKTGTITKGNFAVTGVHHSPLEEEKLLEYAALAEFHSSHPISCSLKRAFGRSLDPGRVTDVREISGHGIIASVDGREIAVGNEKLMKKTGADYRSCSHAGTIVHISMDGDYGGHFVITDEIKENARAAVSALKKAGVERTVMLTGDSESVAEKVAAEAGISDHRSELLPGDKVSCLEELLGQCGPGRRLAYVGDGINDAPVLARADVGIAMGALGSDAAIEAADVVLTDDDPMKISKAILISRKCMGIVRQNIVFSLAVKLVCLILAALGAANMWVAVIADVGVMVLAVCNAIRCLFVKNV